MLTIPASTRRANRRSACGIGSGKPSAPVEGCPKPMNGSPGSPGAFLLVNDEMENRNVSGASIGPAEWPVRSWAEEASTKAEQRRLQAWLKRGLCHRQACTKRRRGHNFHGTRNTKSPWNVPRCGHCLADQSQCPSTSVRASWNRGAEADRHGCPRRADIFCTSIRDPH